MQAIGETVKGYEASALFGMGAPTKTPKEIIAKLNAEINAVLADPAVKKQLVELGGEPRIADAGSVRRRDRRRDREVEEGGRVRRPQGGVNALNLLRRWYRRKPMTKRFVGAKETTMRKLVLAMMALTAAGAATLDHVCSRGGL